MKYANISLHTATKICVILCLPLCACCLVCYLFNDQTNPNNNGKLYFIELYRIIRCHETLSMFTAGSLPENPQISIIFAPNCNWERKMQTIVTFLFCSFHYTCTHISIKSGCRGIVWSTFVCVIGLVVAQVYST